MNVHQWFDATPPYRMTHFVRYCPDVSVYVGVGEPQQSASPSLSVCHIYIRLECDTETWPSPQPASQPATNTENKKWSHSAKQDSCIEDSRQLRLGRRSSLQVPDKAKLTLGGLAR